MTTTLNNITFKAHTHPKHRFQNLYGLLNTDLLYESWGQLNKKAVPGIDGCTIAQYQANFVENINYLGHQLKQKCYRAKDIKRIFIPKSNGKQRPLGLPTVSDKLVQQSWKELDTHKL